MKHLIRNTLILISLIILSGKCYADSNAINSEKEKPIAEIKNENGKFRLNRQNSGSNLLNRAHLLVLRQIKGYE